MNLRPRTFRTPAQAARSRHLPSGLVAWGVLGFVGSSLVVAGVAQPASPFTSKLPESWWFGVPSGASVARPADQWLGVLAVYAGLVAVLVGWYGLVTASRRAGDDRVGPLAVVLATWVAPLLVGPPLMSRDVYAYAAQGALAARGLDPYGRTVTALGSSPYRHLVDPLWRHVVPPYGPLFEEVARAAAMVGGGRVPATVEGLRLAAAAGVALLAVAVPVIARSYGRRGSTAFALAVLNPLVLLMLVGGAHNDAVMVGLLGCGLAAARRRHLVLAVGLCGLAATVKLPALAGAAFVGWTWPGDGAGWVARARTGALSTAGGVAVVAAVGVASGWGWGWLTAADPGKVVSWLDPATAAGLAAARLLSALGLGGHEAGAVAVARAGGLVLAAAVGLLLLVHSDRLGLPAALGGFLLVLALLGPIVWPWYETWGVALLAVTAGTAARRLVCVLSAIGCFATVPSHLAISAGQAAVAGTALALWCAAGAFSAWWWRARGGPSNGGAGAAARPAVPTVTG